MTFPRTSDLRSRLADRTQGSASLGRRAALMAGVGLLAVTTSAQADVGRLSSRGSQATVDESAGVLPPVSLPAHGGRLRVSAVAVTPLAGWAGDASAVPGVALSAYQRAATVINEADPTCHLSWALLAGLGRVESDHGRARGNSLNAAGVAVPGIFGDELNGRRARPRVDDTDRGAVDSDARFDRAVGPFQFLPSTWRDVAVDADGDGRRDPQDINDAALAAAVHLCSGRGDLGRPGPQRAAVLRLVRDGRATSIIIRDAEEYAAAGAPATPAPLVAQPIAVRPAGVPVPGPSSDPSGPARHHGGAASTQSAGHDGSHHSVPQPHPTSGSTPTAPQPPTLAGCESEVLPPSVTSLVGGVLGGTLAQVVSTVRALPLVGSRLAAALTSCMRVTDG